MRLAYMEFVEPIAKIITYFHEWHFRGEAFRVFNVCVSSAIMIVFPMPEDPRRTFLELTAQLNELAEKLKSSTSLMDRRALLKQFRIMLDEAEKLTATKSTPN